MAEARFMPPRSFLGVFAARTLSLISVSHHLIFIDESFIHALGYVAMSRRVFLLGALMAFW
jgi:hypothetical protein